MCALGYGNGVHAPGHKHEPGTEPYLAAHHVLLAHARVYARYKESWGARPIGITLNEVLSPIQIQMLTVGRILREDA